jgi:peptidoglycan/xylan/chitin deacetylase (PgdA/CDA1 family)
MGNLWPSQSHPIVCSLSQANRLLSIYLENPRCSGFVHKSTGRKRRRTSSFPSVVNLVGDIQHSIPSTGGGFRNVTMLFLCCRLSTALDLRGRLDWNPAEQMMRKLAKRMVLGSGVLRFAARWGRNGAAILMYHSVVEDPSRLADSLDGISHSRQVFQEQMELLAREFHPVTLDRLRRFVLGDNDLPRRSVVISFDDGYADNYEVAMPILDRLGIPAVFYVTVDCIDRRTLPWPSRLRFAFRTTKRKNWTGESGRVWTLESLADREQAYWNSCETVCQEAGAELQSTVSRLESQLDARLSVDSGRLMMTWDQIRGLAKRGYIVGSHTMTHPNMARIGKEDVRREFAESKEQMEKCLGATIDHFCYPCPALFPSWNEETAEESRRIGYQTAVTTNPGLVGRADNPLLLKRVPPSKTVDGLSWNLEKAFAERIA